MAGDLKSKNAYELYLTDLTTAYFMTVITNLNVMSRLVFSEKYCYKKKKIQKILFISYNSFLVYEKSYVKTCQFKRNVQFGVFQGDLYVSFFCDYSVRTVYEVSSNHFIHFNLQYMIQS